MVGEDRGARNGAIAPGATTEPAATAGAAVALLGTPRLRLAGAWSPLPPDRRGQLLAILALACDWVERDRIADLLWRDLPLEAARRNLRHLVHTSMRRGAAPGLEANRRALRWVVASDVGAFDGALARGDWGAAVAVYAGPLLAGFELRAPAAFADWVDVEREQRRLRWRAAALEWARYAGATVGAAAVAAALGPLVEEDLDEEALLVVLDLLERGGERVRARMLLDAFRHRVGELFGVEPGAEVRRRMAVAPEAAPSAAAAVAGTAFAPARAASPAFAPARAASPAFAPAPSAPPSDAVPLVGRDDELRRLGAWLDAGERLVTIVGPAGVGKSRLAQVLAHERVGATGRILVAEIGGAVGVRRVAATIARAAGALLDEQDAPAVALLRVVDDGASVLVLDDVEDGALLAPLLEVLLAARPTLVVVATGPAPLRWAGERVLPLAGLDHGGTAELPPERARSLPAVALFEALATRHAPGFVLADADLEAVRAVADAIDGLPLGLELAAPWVRNLPVSELARQVVGDPDFLATPGRRAPARHHSLRAAFQHAAGLLGDAERRALTRLAVFGAPFSRDAAVVVSEAPLPILASLADRSLLRLDADHRYALPGPVRAFAREALAADPDAERAVLARLVSFAEGLVHGAFPDDGFPGADAVARADREGAHLVAACEAAAALGASDALARLTMVAATTYELRGRHREALELVERALARLPRGRRRGRGQRGRLQAQRAWLRHWSDPDAARALATEARAELPAGDHLGHAWVLRTLAMAAWRGGDYASAEAHVRAALERAVRADHGGWRAVLLDGLGLCLTARGAYAAAEAAQREALALNERHDNPFQAVQNLVNLASHARRRGDPRTGAAYALRAVDLARDVGYAQYVPHALTQRAACLLAAGEAAGALAAADEAVAAAVRAGDGYVRIWSLLVQAEAREAGGSPDAAAALGHGLAGALAAHDVKQVLEGILLVSRFAIARGDLDTAALALASTRLAASTPAVVRREAAALGRRIASDLGPARRRAVARRARALGLEGAVQELRAWVAAWGADGWRDGPGGVVS